MDRELYLDGVPEGLRSQNVREIKSSEDITELYESWYLRGDSQTLTLDCRSLTEAGYNKLLKFIEEYKGPIRMFGLEPIPAPILSRFTQVEKKFVGKPGMLVEIRLKEQRIRKSLWERIQGMYGLGSPQEDLDDEFD